MANSSKINLKLAAAQHSNAMQYFAFGDSIYVPDTHIRRRHGAAEGHPNKDQRDREDHALNSVREFVENHFGLQRAEQDRKLDANQRNFVLSRFASQLPRVFVREPNKQTI